MHENTNVFVFMSLVYNHEKYILEHLESIKYLVETYGKNYQVDLYVNDDASRDNSRELIDRWLSVNSFMFRHVKRFFNSKNLGTCKSVINMLSSVSNDIGVCKITAGDDIYSFENIFEVSKINNNYSFLSGIPLHFSDDDLYVDNIEYMGILASQCIYKDRPLIDRFKYLSVSNAPNMFYNTKLLTSDYTLSFLKKFDVVEDWPIQISIAEQNSGEPFLIERKVYVYYRRTKGSAYIVANRRFINDKIKIYEHLESSACGILERYLISNRKWLFILNNSKLNKIFNLCFYSFLFSLLINLKEVVFYKKSIKIDIAAHNNHLSLIRDKSTSFIDENILV